MIAARQVLGMQQVIETIIESSGKVATILLHPSAMIPVM